MMRTNTLPLLDLPNRWEKLEAKAAKVGIDPREFVERVDDAASRVDSLLRLVRSSGGGVFEIFLGLSGSGKTTFVNSLPRFFSGIEVTSVPADFPLEQLKKFISDHHVANTEKMRVFLIERRDNPDESTVSSARAIFSNLLDFFRTEKGSCLVIWTITDEIAATRISEAAWHVGRDSICDQSTKGIFKFNGLSKSKYIKVADDTAKNLAGDGLEAFGLTSEICREALRNCDTLSDFYGKLVFEAERVRGQTWSILKERVHPRLWIVLPGDTRAAINSTVKALTQGTRSRIDIDLICEFIDDPINQAIYVEEWKRRRSAIAHLFRAVDVRLFSLPPNVSVAAVRSFGDEALKEKLIKPSAQRSQAADALRSTRIYKEILFELDIDRSPHAERGVISTETEDEYRRIQVQASTNDKPLNKALGQLFSHALKVDAPNAVIDIEKKCVGNTNLQPDIHLRMNETDVICIEPTWRSSGQPITGEEKSRQNTLAEGHLKQYILGKTLEYVKALGL